MRVLLSSVFKPFGVDDAFSRAHNVVELFHNQVTREQGIFSIRAFHPSFGLHWIAHNIAPPTTVLDFPSEAEFVAEVKKGYDYVGIAYIMCNFEKAAHMVELIRKHAPKSKVVLGGHGTMVSDTDGIGADHVCRGEGIGWFRKLLGEAERPFKHPVLPASFGLRVLGVPVPVTNGHLVGGLGCPNACRFCSTSHFFGKKYLPFLKTGRDIFAACCRLEDVGGYNNFFVMDENFLKSEKRARELLQLMEESGRFFQFGVFSSAETVTKLGPEVLSRLGIHFLWLGVESKRCADRYPKNRGVDFASLIEELRSYGIAVLASGILFEEHHDKETIWEDIEYIASLRPDLAQFMGLGPLPGTALYEQYEAEGRIRGPDLPFAERDGQNKIWFRHPHFDSEESGNYLRRAFQHEYDENGPSILRICDTTLRGYRRHKDADLRSRTETFRKRAYVLRMLLPAICDHAHNVHAQDEANRIAEEYMREFGPMTLNQRMFAQVARFYAGRELKRGTGAYQPRTIVTQYPTTGMPRERLLPRIVGLER